MDNQTLITYEQFIRVITKNINDHFEDQKEYICCKEGCSHCCERGAYPCSLLELEYLSIGYGALPVDVQNKINDNIEQIKKEKAEFNGGEKAFSYKCPFLIDNKCSVYDYRLLVCRAFGLIYYNDKKEIGGENPLRIPFCYEKGLNYSKVYDEKENQLSLEKYQELGYKKEPVAYNLYYNKLRDAVGKEMMNLDFGEEKSLIEWL